MEGLFEMKSGVRSGEGRRVLSSSMVRLRACWFFDRRWRVYCFHSIILKVSF